MNNTATTSDYDHYMKRFRTWHERSQTYTDPQLRAHATLLAQYSLQQAIDCQPEDYFND